MDNRNTSGENTRLKNHCAFRITLPLVSVPLSKVDQHYLIQYTHRVKCLSIVKSIIYHLYLKYASIKYIGSIIRPITTVIIVIIIILPMIDEIIIATNVPIK